METVAEVHVSPIVDEIQRFHDLSGFTYEEQVQIESVMKRAQDEGTASVKLPSLDSSIHSEDNKQKSPVSSFSEKLYGSIENITESRTAVVEKAEIQIETSWDFVPGRRSTFTSFSTPTKHKQYIEKRSESEKPSGSWDLFECETRANEEDHKEEAEELSLFKTYDAETSETYKGDIIEEKEERTDEENIYGTEARENYNVGENLEKSLWIDQLETETKASISEEIHFDLSIVKQEQTDEAQVLISAISVSSVQEDVILPMQKNVDEEVCAIEMSSGNEINITDERVFISPGGSPDISNKDIVEQIDIEVEAFPELEENDKTTKNDEFISECEQAYDGFPQIQDASIENMVTSDIATNEEIERNEVGTEEIERISSISLESDSYASSSISLESDSYASVVPTEPMVKKFKSDDSPQQQDLELHENQDIEQHEAVEKGISVDVTTVNVENPITDVDTQADFENTNLDRIETEMPYEEMVTHESEKSSADGGVASRKTSEPVKLPYLTKQLSVVIPDLSHLSEEEREHIENVLSKAADSAASCNLAAVKSQEISQKSTSDETEGADEEVESDGECLADDEIEPSEEPSHKF